MFVEIRFDKTECNEHQEKILHKWVLQNEKFGERGLISGMIQIDSTDQLWELQDELGIMLSLSRNQQDDPIIITK